MTKAAIVRRIPRTPSRLSRDPFFSDTDRLFNEFLHPGSLFGHWMGEGLRDSWMPPVDVKETENAFVFTAELPGLSKEDIEITLEDNLLTLTGERSFAEDDERESYHRVERSYGKFSRSFSLPAQVDSSNVEASHKDGVLSIEIAKSEQAKPRKIDIG